ncbi:MAG: 4Fe-4S binding protein [Dehalococcoidia bacterium]|nr:4Fe-4S binding protein [Dehalococcoidia bacterium]
MIVQYGYTDGTGEYYLIIDTDQCSGCENCVPACPSHVFEMYVDDDEETKAKVRRQATKALGTICPGNLTEGTDCQGICRTICATHAISHSWGWMT